MQMVKGHLRGVMTGGRVGDGGGGGSMVGGRWCVSLWDRYRISPLFLAKFAGEPGQKLCTNTTPLKKKISLIPPCKISKCVQEKPGSLLNRENRENDQKDSLSGKTQEIDKLYQYTGNFVCSSCKFPDSKA